MSPAAFLLIAVVGSVLGSLLVLVRAREPKRGMHDTIAGFRRELAALSPERSPDAEVREASRQFPLTFSDEGVVGTRRSSAPDDVLWRPPPSRQRDGSDYFGPLYGADEDVH